MSSKFALLIGNSEYDKMIKLTSPANDINSINDVLEKAGYDSICKTNLKLDDFKNSIKEFCEKLVASVKCESNKSEIYDSDIGIFYFAGHGIQVNGENFLCPIDMDGSNLTDTAITIKDRVYIAKSESINFFKDIIQEIANTKIPVKIFVLDCCRSEIQFTSCRGISSDNNFSNSLASVDAPFGSMISYSTSPGQPASDGEGDNSPFVKALIKNISIPGLSIEEVFKKTRIELYSLTNQKQVSWEHSSLIGDVCLFPLTSIENFSIEYEKSTYVDRFSNIVSVHIGEFVDKLKSYDWYIQNSILQCFKPFLFNNPEGLNMNDLFLLGRNFLQAAYGDANDIKGCLNNIIEITETWSEYNIFHFTNGILYEIFFNSNGKCRKNPKYDMDLDSFLLHLKLSEFSNSIIFIKRKLRETNKAFYEDLSTGKDWTANVNVIQQKDDLGKGLNCWNIVGLILNGNNILYMENGKDLVKKDNYNKEYSMLSKYKYFTNRILLMLVIPTNACKLIYPDGINSESHLFISDGFQLLLSPGM